MKINRHNIEAYVKTDSKKDWITIKALLTNRSFNGYIGWDGYGNLGDEAVYAAYEKLFPEGNLQSFRIYGPSLKFNKYLGHEIPIRFAALGGGTLINQSKFWLAQVQYLISKRVPTFCLGTGVASKEFWQNHSEVHAADDLKLWATLLKEFIYVGVRGPKSKAALKGVGLDVEVVGDSAIGLAKESHKKRQRCKVVGINISSAFEGAMWGTEETLVHELANFANTLLQEGYEIRILPIWKGDMKASTVLEGMINNPSCRIIHAYAALADYQAAVEECDLFVGEKLHATVLATIARIPALMLEYRPKCLDYMESVGLGEYSIRTDLASADVLYEKFQRLIQHRESIISSLDERVLYYKNLQQLRAMSIKKALGL